LTKLFDGTTSGDTGTVPEPSVTQPASASAPQAANTIKEFRNIVLAPMKKAGTIAGRSNWPISPAILPT
jgi:hypothetical protein